MHNEIADALATLSSMLQYPDDAHIDPLYIQIRDQHAYCNMIKEDLMASLGFMISKHIFSLENVRRM